MSNARAEVHFLFTNAAKMRSLARRCAGDLKAELLSLARALEGRASDLEKRATAAGDANPETTRRPRQSDDRPEDGRL